MKSYRLLAALSLSLLASRTPAAQESLLYNLSEGTPLKVLSPIRIHANNSLQQISNPISAKFKCYLRMKHSEPFDRIIPEGRELVVLETRREAVSAKGLVQSWTRLILRARAIEEILCTAAKNAPDPTVQQFREAVRGIIQVQNPPPPLEVR